MKKTLWILAIFLAHFAVAQKMSSKSLNVSFHINPTQPIGEEVVEYSVMLITPMKLLTREEEIQALMEMEIDTNLFVKAKRQEVIEKARRKKFDMFENQLVINGNKFRKGTGWLLTLETSDVAVSYINEKSISELSSSDDVMRYTYSANLKIQDRGKPILEKAITEPGNENRMTKGELLLNPIFKLKAGLNANNPEKLKKITDNLLERKNDLILQRIIQLTHRELNAAFEKQFRKFTISIFSVKGKGFEELNDIRDKILETNMKFNAFSKKNRLPKEAMDNVLKEAIPVWEKHLASATDLEDKARKGLMLNIAFAHTWTGDYEKAGKILDQISETFVADPFEIQPEESSSPGETFLPFSTYAENLRMLFEYFRKHGEFITIYQG